jgi:hypothetical protein
MGLVGQGSNRDFANGLGQVLDATLTYAGHLTVIRRRGFASSPADERSVDHRRRGDRPWFSGSDAGP